MNPFDNKCIFIDEAHTLFRTQGNRHNPQNRKWLIKALTDCRRSILCLFTASPIVNDPLQGIQMGRLVRGLEKRQNPEQDPFSNMENMISKIKSERRSFTEDEKNEFKQGALKKCPDS